MTSVHSEKYAQFQHNLQEASLYGFIPFLTYIWSLLLFYLYHFFLFRQLLSLLSFFCISSVYYDFCYALLLFSTLETVAICVGKSFKATFFCFPGHPHIAL